MREQSVAGATNIDGIGVSVERAVAHDSVAASTPDLKALHVAVLGVARQIPRRMAGSRNTPPEALPIRHDQAAGDAVPVLARREPLGKEQDAVDREAADRPGLRSICEVG